MKHIKVVANVISALSAILALGCSQQVYVLRMEPELEPNDESAVSGGISAKHKKFLLAVPPTMGRESLANVTSLLETEFIKAGLTLISPLKAGLPAGREGRPGSPRGPDVPADGELLRAAKDAGAEVVVQISKFEWSAKPKPTRFFILESLDSRELSEVNSEDYNGWDGRKYSYSSPMLTCLGNILSVETGHILGSLKIETAANWNLPREYLAKFTYYESSWALEEENFKYNDPWWTVQSKKEAEKRVAQLIARKVLR